MACIGVGIITFNRLETFKRCLESVQKYTHRKNRIVVADDGSTEGNQALCVSKGAECLTGKTLGIAKNKNRALWALRDCDAIVLIEDDTVVLKKDWANRFLRISKEIREQHLCMNCHPHKLDRVKVRRGHKIRYAHLGNGFCMFMTKKVLKVCGGFDPRFGRYGREHCDLSFRIHRAKLSRGIYPHPESMTEFVRQQRVSSVLPKSVKDKSVPFARKVAVISQKETMKGKLFRGFGP